MSIFSTDPAAINELAIKIAGPTQDPEILDCSSTIAAAELDLKRIRRVRASLFGAAGISGLMETSTKRSRGEQPFAARRSTLGDLQNIDRYERRAIARRDKALRRLLRLKRKIER